MKEIVFLNGKFISKDEAQLPLITPGFLYGWGLFETMRSYNNKILYLNAHLTRIKNSSKLIKMIFPYSPARLKKIIERTVKMNDLKDAYVRLTLWKKSHNLTDTSIIVRRYKPFSVKKYKRGFNCSISHLRLCEGSHLTRLKTTNYLLYQLSYLEAKNKGFDEAIILNKRGYICEASHSNIFLVKDNEIFTPSLACGCLDGITRQVIFDMAKKYNIKIGEGRFTLGNLYEADEAFLTNSLMGVMPLKSIEKQLIDGPGKITRFFMKKYNLLLRGLLRRYS